MFRLKELRLSNGIKRSDFAREIGINAGTIANYENAIREAPYEFLVKFADYFDVSVDYLLGREDETGVCENCVGERVLSSAERELIRDFRKLSPFAQSRVAEYCRLWQNQITSDFSD